jgi:hypothetical protein
MKKCLICLVCLVFVVIISGCKSTVTWDPSGSWLFTISYQWESLTYSETLILTGTDANGTVTGYTIFNVNPPQNGTYTKTGDYSLTIHFDFIDIYSYHILTDFLGTSSEADPNSMSGTGTWYLDGSLYDNITFIATKTSNQQ